MAMLMVMMIAVDPRVDQLASEECFDCRVGIAECSGADFNACLCKRVLSALSHASADKRVYAAVLEQPRQRLMSYSVRAHHFRRNDFAVLDFIYFEVLCSSEMLKDVSVIVCYSYFHSVLLLLIIFSI